MTNEVIQVSWPFVAYVIFTALVFIVGGVAILWVLWKGLSW